MKKTKQLFIILNLFLLTTMPGFLLSQDNYSLDFSYGNYGRIPMSETLSNFETFTMECWYYETDFTGGDERIVGHETANSTVGGYEISNGAGSYSASIQDGENGLGGSYIATIVQNTWSHLAILTMAIPFGSSSMVYKNIQKMET